MRRGSSSCSAWSACVRTLRTRPTSPYSLAALKDWTFLFGPGLVVPFGNGLILGYLMYTSGLVPRPLTWLGLIGGPVLLVQSLGECSSSWWEADRRGELFS